MRFNHPEKWLLALLATLFWITFQPAISRAATHPTPVIDDQLHLLDNDQIHRMNKNLMNKRHPQQIWVITTNKTPKELKADWVEYEDIEDSGFSFGNLSNDAFSYTDIFLKKHIKNLTDSGTIGIAGMPARDEINLILVDPQLKYHVIPVMSDPFGQALGQVQDFILTHRMNFKEMSGKNILSTARLMNGFLVSHVSSKKQINQGLSFDGLVIRLLLILLVIYGIWHHRWRKRHPKRIRWEDPDSPRDNGEYDNGYMDGYYIGMHEDDGHDK
ncbi:hypothetical protein [Lentilactobacillus kefiri]|uniref:Uncharacterized protein n=2 Tax=Lentilactobacillus kefiri TaxID=33962 RepID=A0A8E1RJX2_LENKE|nr:hypothetical protein [Lentilactobacillus kefiri]KRL75493.1 hypothetical protein FD08_GL001434 [Lentilactobacillus parakefiri DSM 10551]KRM53617.1 hypothetical protein FC95_GL000704 [Lentilactobacillus kefiri DSM 20587 = JCM 5818]MCJ2161088.1 hypothetical protein [Lentilactobacillus kefiri]MCP9369375.1 hypothetical protein [Lentilactobacillus kefiri]MDH5109359.1 hypothetical protein [Lentilactobacillus kefiri]